MLISRSENMTKIYVPFLLAMLMWNAQAYEGESIVLDPATGNYIITYMGDEDKLMQTTFVPATKIMPSVRSAFRLDKDFVVTYRYSVSNASNSPNPIDGFMVDDVVNPIIGELPFPHEATGVDWLKPYHDAIKANIATPGWSAGIARDASYSLKRIHWMVLDTNPAYPGSLFWLGSHYLDSDLRVLIYQVLANQNLTEALQFLVTQMMVQMRIAQSTNR